MKKVFLGLVICLFAVACFVCYTFRWTWDVNGRGLSVKVHETASVYQFSASYNKQRTSDLQHYLDAKLHTNNFFRHSRINGTVTLDDATNLYVKTSPGRLLIKLKKKENDHEAYLRIKQLGKDIRQHLADN